MAVTPWDKKADVSGTFTLNGQSLLEGGGSYAPVGCHSHNKPPELYSNCFKMVLFVEACIIVNLVLVIFKTSTCLLYRWTLNIVLLTY